MSFPSLIRRQQSLSGEGRMEQPRRFDFRRDYHSAPEMAVLPEIASALLELRSGPSVRQADPRELNVLVTRLKVRFCWRRDANWILLVSLFFFSQALISSSL